MVYVLFNTFMDRQGYVYKRSKTATLYSEQLRYALLTVRIKNVNSDIAVNIISHKNY